MINSDIMGMLKKTACETIPTTAPGNLNDGIEMEGPHDMETSSLRLLKSLHQIFEMFLMCAVTNLSDMCIALAAIAEEFYTLESSARDHLRVY